jgi:hypothetical protein
MFNNIKSLLSSNELPDNLKVEISNMSKASDIILFLSNPLNNSVFKLLINDFDNFYYENFHTPSYRLKNYYNLESITDFEFDLKNQTGSCIIKVYFDWTHGGREETSIFFDFSWLFNEQAKPWRKIWINDNINYVKRTLKIEESKLANLLGLTIDTLNSWKQLTNLKHLNKLNNLYNYLLIDEKRLNKYEFLNNSRIKLNVDDSNEEESVSLINFLNTNDRLTESQISSSIKSCELYEKELLEYELYKRLENKYKG